MDSSGIPHRFILKESCNYPNLDKLAIDAVKSVTTSNFKFLPARKDGKAIPYVILLPLYYSARGMKIWDITNKTRNANSDGLINCLLQPGLFHHQLQKSMRVNSFQLIKFCCTRTDPAAETKSIGLQADARVVMVFASPSRQFYRDMTNPAHLSGPRHLDNFIVTRNLHPFTGTLQKHMPTLTRTATN